MDDFLETFVCRIHKSELQLFLKYAYSLLAVPAFFGLGGFSI